LIPPVTPNEAQFFKALGTRIAELRKEQSLSQQALADGNRSASGVIVVGGQIV